MKPDINGLTEAELIDLNNRIVERLRFPNQARAHLRMLDFKIGNRVRFQPERHGIVAGMLARCSRKTLTVVTGAGSDGASPEWNRGMRTTSVSKCRGS
jgi:hypothetical protein